MGASVGVPIAAWCRLIVVEGVERAEKQLFDLRTVGIVGGDHSRIMINKMPPLQYFPLSSWSPRSKMDARPADEALGSETLLSGLPAV